MPHSETLAAYPLSS